MNQSTQNCHHHCHCEDTYPECQNLPRKDRCTYHHGECRHCKSPTTEDIEDEKADIISQISHWGDEDIEDIYLTIGDLLNALEEENK